MEYTEIKPDMTIADLIRSGAYGAFADYIFTDMTPDRCYAKLSEFGFNTVGFVPGLHRMEELAASDGKRGATFVKDIYSEEERLANWDLARVKLLYFPAQTAGEDGPKPYALVIPGGGFNRQWGFVEGEAIAAALNKKGIPAFVLYYRVKQEPLMPKPLEDMYRAIRYIDENADSFHVLPGHYMLAGFSAGAVIASEAGSLNFGWNSAPADIPNGAGGLQHWAGADVARPELIALGYTVVSNKASLAAYESAPEGSARKASAAAFLRRVGGPLVDAASTAPYELIDFIDETYPKTYLVANEDDPVVPVVNTKALDKKLSELNVPHITRIGRKGGHSFGLGIGLEVEGWLDECVDFWLKA
ncbi:MAG: alpha/beta hydrolase [Lachnospiraceae bacterium]|jgi:acetyl esterase/lipase|nr:alpha/beta hydrolase [Lachnospiraceae bacterium]MCH4069980.1 alpha/beta hydrolase [Lachnospiraceae bacterium]MCH4108667.1 alpha/beta hydrolase [Lachnospiraceae bacterium]MCI1302818.1 alpha/beta hydrolase [Lachnospiraceae bacterium]MCI1332045.1 alpha/beta hydrolase [Lachnospiraceae bacterium]